MVAQLIAQWLVFQARLSMPVSLGGYAGTGASFNGMAALLGGQPVTMAGGSSASPAGFSFSGIGTTLNGGMQNMLPNMFGQLWGTTDIDAFGTAYNFLNANPLISGSMFAGLGNLIVKGLFQGDWVGGIVSGATSALGYAAGGAMLGSLLGSWAGPVGAIIGSIAGEALMSLFKDNDPDEAWFRILDRSNLSKGVEGYLNGVFGSINSHIIGETESAFGKITIYGKDRGNYGVNTSDFDSNDEAAKAIAQHITDTIAQIDNSIAASLDKATKDIFSANISRDIFSGEFNGDADATFEQRFMEVIRSRYAPAFNAIHEGLGKLISDVAITGDEKADVEAIQKALATAGQIVVLSSKVPDFWKRYDEQLRQGLSAADAATKIQDQYNKVSQWLSPLILNALTDSLKTMNFNDFKTLFALNLYNAIQQGIVTALGNKILSDLVAKLFDNALGIDDVMAKVVSGEMSMEEFKSKMKELYEQIVPLLDAAEPAYKVLIEWIQTFIEPAQTAANAAKQLTVSLDSLVSTIKSDIESLNSAIKSAGDTLSGFFGNDFKARWIEFQGQQITSKYGSGLITDPQQLINLGSALYAEYDKWRVIAEDYNKLAGGDLSIADKYGINRADVTPENLSAWGNIIDNKLKELGTAVEDFSNYIQLYGEWISIYEQKAKALEDAYNSTKSNYINALQEEINTRQKELDAIKQTISELTALRDGIEKYRAELAGTIATPTQSIQAARAQWESVLAKANAGDVEAQKTLVGIAQQYMSVAKNVGSYDEYLRQYIKVQQGLSQISSKVTNQIIGTNYNEEILKALEEQLAELQTHTSLAEAKKAYDDAKLVLEQATWINQLNALKQQIAAINSGFDTTTSAVNSTTAQVGNVNSSITYGTSATTTAVNKVEKVNSDSLTMTYMLVDEIRAMSTGLGTTINYMSQILYTGFTNPSKLSSMSSPFNMMLAMGDLQKSIVQKYTGQFRLLTYAELSSVFKGFAEKIKNNTMTDAAWKAYNDYYDYLQSGVWSTRFGYAEGGITTGSEQGHWELLHGTEAVIPLGKGNIELKTPGLNSEIAELKAEISALRKDLFIANAEMVKHNKKTARYIESWDVNGMPAVRTL